MRTCKGENEMKPEPVLNDAILAEKLQKDPELQKFYHQEQLILEVTELVAKLMHKHKINKTEFAKRLGKGKSYITQLLDGTSNMTLRTISDVFVALESMLVVNAGPLCLESTQPYDESYYELENAEQATKRGVLPEESDSPVVNNEIRIIGRAAA